MIIQVCQHFSLDFVEKLFLNHEEGLNEMLLENDHRTKLTKCVWQIPNPAFVQVWEEVYERNCKPRQAKHQT